MDVFAGGGVPASGTIADQAHTMSNPSPSALVGRRDVVLGATAAGAFLTLLGVAARAQQPQAAAPAGPAPPPVQQVTWQEAMRDMIGQAQPVEGRIRIEIPPVAENGNLIPFSVAIDSPMSEQEFVKAIHIFSTANPKPDVASAYFSQLSGRAMFGGRLRLGRSQEVVAVAELSDGRVFLAKRAVQVTIGGCGTG